MPAAWVQTSTESKQEGPQRAPYCITMLLTLDYGETAKGKPEAPKAQTPYYCTGQSRASSSENSTQRVQYSPSVNKKTPALRAPASKLHGEKGGHVARPVPKDSEWPEPSGWCPPTIRILKPNRPPKRQIPIPIGIPGSRAAKIPIRIRILRVH